MWTILTPFKINIDYLKDISFEVDEVNRTVFNNFPKMRFLLCQDWDIYTDVIYNLLSYADIEHAHDGDIIKVILDVTGKDWQKFNTRTNQDESLRESKPQILPPLAVRNAMMNKYWLTTKVVTYRESNNLTHS